MKPVFILICLFLVACGASNKKEEGFVARVGDETLTKEGLLFLAGNRAGDADVFSRAINRWVEKKLLCQAARSIGLNKDLALINERDRFYESLLISSFIEIQIEEKTETTKKEVSDYYLKNKESFKRIDDEVVVKHFVFSTNKAAKKVKKELKKKKPKVDIEKLLKEQKVETKTLRRVDAGSNLVGFVFAGEPGDVLGPKKNGEDFHVFQILQKHARGSYLGLEIVYDEIYQRIYKKKEVLVLGSILDSLYLNSDVFISREIFGQ